MKIDVLNPDGVHKREIKGLKALGESLPDDWFAYASLEMIGNDGGEIDLIICAPDRLIAVEIKDWNGTIKEDGHYWLTSGRREKAPTISIREKAKKLASHLKRHLTQKVAAPWIDDCVLLTGKASRRTLSKDSQERTFDLEFFVKIGTAGTFSKAFPKKGSYPTSIREFQNSTMIRDLKPLLDEFFLRGHFSPATKKYNGYAAEDTACFQHPQKIYDEYFAKKTGVKGFNALLRIWDFNELGSIDAAYRNKENFERLALREENAIGYLQDKNPQLATDKLFLSPISNEGRDSVTMNFFELYDLPGNLTRLKEATHRYRGTLKLEHRVSMAMLLVSNLAALHELDVAHRDIGEHCIWVDVPHQLSLSGFATASIPEQNTISQVRTTIKANASTLPEDLLDYPSDNFRKDVFLLGVSVHQLIFCEKPKCTDGVPEWQQSSEKGTDKFSSWFEKALNWEPEKRFANAMEALEAFKSCSKVDRKQEFTENDFAEFRSDRSLFPNPATDTIIKQENDCLIYRTQTESHDSLIKLWANAKFSNIDPKTNANLHKFLRRCIKIQKHDLPTNQTIVDVGLTMFGAFVDLKWNAGNTLETVDLSDCNDSKITALIKALITAVRDLHDLKIYHGDLKPSNILITSNKNEEFDVLLLDLVDFAPLGTQRRTPAYCPPEDEDASTSLVDGYALRAIILAVLEKELSNVSLERASDLQACLKDLYSTEGGCKPDFEGALHQIQGIEIEAQEEHVEPLIIYSANISKDLILEADDRGLPMAIYPHKTQDEKCLLVIHGANTRHHFFVVRETGEIDGHQMFPSSQSDFILAMKRPDKFLKSDIHLKRGGDEDFMFLEEALSDLNLNELGKGCPQEARTKNDADVYAVTSDPDLFIDEDVCVPDLWKAIIEAEEEIIPSVTVEGETEEVDRLGLYKIEVSESSKPLDSEDWEIVDVESLSRDHHWLPIGTLENQKSEIGKIVIKPKYRDFSAPAEGTMLRLHAKRSKSSYQRRLSAINRILDRRSVSRNLIDIFSGDEEQAKLVKPSPKSIQISKSYGLNNMQEEALRNALYVGPLALIQGPPGTGKTRVIATAVHHISEINPSAKILVVSQSHEAVNHATNQIVKLFKEHGSEPSLVRVGRRETVSDDLISYHSASLQATYRNRFQSHLTSRIAPLGKELGLPPEYVDEMTIMRARFMPVLKQLEHDDEGEPSANPPSSQRRRFYDLCRQHGDPCIEQSPEKVYRLIEKEVADRHSVTNHTAVKELKNLIDLALEWVDLLEASGKGYDTFLVKTNHIITGTCVGIGRWDLGIEKETFDWVIIDEAARCGPGELSVAMQVGLNIILLGDHKQLPPHFDRDMTNKVTGKIGCSEKEARKSDFQRVFESPLGHQVGRSLSTQYRMAEPINRLVSKCFYPEIGGLDTGRAQSPPLYEDMPAMLKSTVTWINTDSDEGESKEEKSGTSYINKHEVEAILKLLEELAVNEQLVTQLEEEALAKGVEAAIGIITAYKAQAHLIQDQVWASSLPSKIRKMCKIDTVDSYQGKENPIIIFTPSRTNLNSITGHTKSEERINVSLSRAQDRLVIVSSLNFWKETNNTPLARVADFITKHQQSGDQEYNIINVK